MKLPISGGRMGPCDSKLPTQSQNAWSALRNNRRIPASGLVQGQMCPPSVASKADDIRDQIRTFEITFRSRKVCPYGMRRWWTMRHACVGDDPVSSRESRRPSTRYSQHNQPCHSERSEESIDFAGRNRPGCKHPGTLKCDCPARRAETSSAALRSWPRHTRSAARRSWGQPVSPGHALVLRPAIRCAVVSRP